MLGTGGKGFAKSGDARVGHKLDPPAACGEYAGQCFGREQVSTCSACRNQRDGNR